MATCLPALNMTASPQCAFWTVIGMFRAEARRQGWAAHQIENVTSAAACSTDLKDGIYILMQFTGLDGELVEVADVPERKGLPAVAAPLPVVAKLKEKRHLLHVQMASELTKLDTEIERAMNGG